MSSSREGLYQPAFSRTFFLCLASCSKCRELRWSGRARRDLKFTNRTFAGSNGRKDRSIHARGADPNEEFIAGTLGMYRTAFGDLTKAEVELLEAIRATAYQEILHCTDHQRQRCACWKDARVQLFDLRQAGEKSALGMAALAVWNSIEKVARKPPPSPITEGDGPPGITYNWRYWKALSQ